VKRAGFPPPPRRTVAASQRRAVKMRRMRATQLASSRAAAVARARATGTARCCACRRPASGTDGFRARGRDAWAGCRRGCRFRRRGPGACRRELSRETCCCGPDELASSKLSRIMCLRHWGQGRASKRIDSAAVTAGPG
jgi:hypothetical protein